MAGTGRVDRFQFRLSGADQRECALYDKLVALPPGKRNAYIVQQLLAAERGGIDADALATVVRAAVQDALRNSSAVEENAAEAPRTVTAIGAAELPDDLLDTSMF